MNQSLYLVAGLGKTGQSIAGYLHRRNLPFVVFDTRLQPEGLDEFSMHFPGVDVFLGELPDALYPQIKEIIASPGVSLDEPFMREAFARQIPVVGDIEYLAREVDVPVIAITGTNGKSTVTTLVGEILQAAGLLTAVAGNIGQPVLDLLDDENHYQAWVLELSSFQLDLVQTLKPRASTILNITPDHLDRHHHFDAYKAAKQRIYQHSSVCVFNKEDANTYPQNIDSTGVALLSFSLQTPAGAEWGIIEQDGINYLAQGNEILLPVEELKIKGKHNWQNILAACALVSALKIDKTIIKAVLCRFGGLPHRCQWIRNVAGVDWINDSKGTNVGATVSALGGIGGALPNFSKIILIAGGLGKGADFTELRPSVMHYARAVILIGQDAPIIAEALKDTVPLFFAHDFNDAILQAKQQAKPADVVLLSPACASFDMFKDFNHRGECFIEAVKRL